MKIYPNSLMGAVCAVAGLFIADFNAKANFHIWTGAVNGYWSNTNNWSGGSAPQIFETPPVEIDFPSGTGRLQTTNDIGFVFLGGLYYLSVDSLIVGDNYTFSGQGYGTNLLFTGNPAMFFGLSLQNIYCPTPNLYILLDGSLNLYLQNTNTITNTIGCTLNIQSTVTGTGGWSFVGTGTMEFSGVNPNSYQGPCTVLSGEVMLEQFNNQYFGDYAPSISSPLTIGTTNTSVPALVCEVASGLSMTIQRAIGSDINHNCGNRTNN